MKEKTVFKFVKWTLLIILVLIILFIGLVIYSNIKANKEEKVKKLQTACNNAVTIVYDASQSIYLLEKYTDIKVNAELKEKVMKDAEELIEHLDINYQGTSSTVFTKIIWLNWYYNFRDDNYYKSSINSYCYKGILVNPPFDENVSATNTAKYYDNEEFEIFLNENIFNNIEFCRDILPDLDEFYHDLGLEECIISWYNSNIDNVTEDNLSYISSALCYIVQADKID